MTDLNAPIVPQEEQTPTVDYTHEELQNESFRDIAENKELPQEEVKEEQPETPEDTQTLKDEERRAIIEEAKAEVLKEFEEKNEPAVVEEVSDEDKEYLDWEKQFNSQNSRPPTYQEAMKFVKGQAIEEIKADLKREEEEIETKKQEEQTRIDAEREENEKKINAVVDDELNDLYNAGKLTKIQNPANPSDQGVIERKALFSKWQEVNTERRTKGLPDITSATRIYEFHYTKPNAQPPGADAPISGNRGSESATGDEQSYSYSDIKKPWSFFKKGS